MDDLELAIDTLDGVPEPLHAFYAADEAGKYRLKVKGIEDTSGLKTALQKEREAKKALEQKVRRWEALGKSDEEIADLLRKQEEQAAKSGDMDAALKRERDRHAKEKADLETRLNAIEKSERQAIISTQLTSALSRAGVTDEGLELLPDRLAGRIKYEMQDGERRISVLGPDGETELAGSQAEAFDALVREASTKYPSLFRGEGKSGGGMRPNTGAGGPGKKRSEMSERERAAFVEKHGLDAYSRLPT
jgi:hypothetical protein